ncbi:Hypothetical predicted protein [Mytilus galloprovincialis]|uniref:non-specific serine/threonine protein kinase n=1 Tax=Mytilus galloprovincialis TaxID=29158 RepID=A0A8B6BRB9_MYTGA|nr:Hypothetical predicted protein [Mytilus galloprovincialis]
MTARRTCIYIHISKGLGDFQDLNIDLHIKCYDDVKFTRNSYLGDMFNNSRTIKIIEFDNFKYNLNYPTNRNKAAISIVILLLANFAVCIVVYRIKWPAIQFCRKIQKQHTKSLKVTNRNDNLIKDGTEIRRYVRIQVIGKDGVGKSSLVRRLVGDSNMKVHSTDGIDIVKKCQIRTTDGKWIIGRVETERKKIINRILDTLHREQKQGELVSDQVIPSEKETNVKDIIPSKGPLSEIERKLENQPATVSIDKSSTNENKVNITETATSVAEKSNIDKPIKDSVILSTNDFQKSADSIKIDDMRKKIFEQMDEILVKVQKDQDQMTSERLVECGIWDFAGQKDYYATHQTFLNPHAIYLLVTNISDDIAATEDNTNFDSIEEYIDFWFDSIHCLRTSSPGHGLNPPVIVVCTHIDEYKTEKEVEDRKKEYIKRFKKCFGGQDKANHNRGIYFISNTEFLKSDFNKLKNKISDVAKEMMYFTEELPMQWIQLENALSVLKDESKQNILSWQTCVELAEMLSIKENELLPFLTYQHNIGNIIFFADIKEYIILQPDWLVKCFRCLVCDNHPQKRNIEIVQLTDWHNLEKTGQLSDKIIDKLFEKEPDLEFGKYKTHILDVMEKFDILVKPKFIDTNNDSSLIPNSYYMPCMIKQQSISLDIIKKMFQSEKCKFSFSPWLILEFKFLPLAYFNHILFYYITRYTVCEKAGQKTLYRGKTLVNLDKTGLRKLCICFSKNAIAFQVLTLSDVKDNIYNTILGELCKKIEELKERLGQSISCDIKAKCSNGDYSNKEGRMTFEELGEMCENGHYLCPEHNEMHSKDDVEKTWLQHADIVIAKLNKEQAENNPRNIVENETSKEETFIHDQASVKNNLPVSVTLRKQLNIKQSTNEDLFITSCIKTGNTLVFTDCDNKRLIICNSDGTDIHHIPLSDKPDYITEIDSNTVAVSCRYDRTILIINISTRSVTSRIKTSGICREYHIMIISCTLLFMGV